MYLFIAFVFGLVFGSFLNAVIYRVPRKESLNTRSHCTTCGKPILWYQNIPLLSWIVLRGRCHNCHEKISVRYPIIELLTALLWVAVTAKFFSEDLGSFFLTLGLLYFLTVSIALAFIDAEKMILPNVLTFQTYVVVPILFTISCFFSSNWGALLSALITAVVFCLVYFTIFMVKPGYLGFGDVKLSLIVGFILGFFGIGVSIFGFFAPFLLAMFYVIPILFLKKKGKKSQIPFGPWIILGTWFSLFFGDFIVNLYLQTFLY